MNDERLDIAGAQPARQPKTVATRFVGDHNPLNRAASLDCFLAPEQRVWVNVQFLQRMPFHGRHDSRNEPTRQTDLDNRNEGVALLERGAERLRSFVFSMGASMNWSAAVCRAGAERPIAFPPPARIAGSFAVRNPGRSQRRRQSGEAAQIGLGAFFTGDRRESR
jgi:hypothetical protein